MSFNLTWSRRWRDHDHVRVHSSRERRQCRDGVRAAQVWPEPPPKKFGEVISDFDPTAAGYEAQALAVERAAQAAMSGGTAVHIGGAGSA